jgi:hypothetical protein
VRCSDDVADWRPLLNFTQGNPLTLTVLVGQALRDGLKSRIQIEQFVQKLRAGEAVFEDEVALDSTDFASGALARDEITRAPHRPCAGGCRRRFWLRIDGINPVIFQIPANILRVLGRKGEGKRPSLDQARSEACQLDLDFRPDVLDSQDGHLVSTEFNIAGGVP